MQALFNNIREYTILSIKKPIKRWNLD